MTLAIDIGGTLIRMAVGSGLGPWDAERSVRRPEGMSPDAFIDLIRETLDQWSTVPSAFGEIGISVAGIVDENGGVLRAENLAWKDVPIRRLVNDALERPTAIDTDVFCGAHYEAVAGAARSKTGALYMAVGTGIGHALIIEGRVWRGALGRANAAGHLVLDPAGTACYCGGHGCLCTIASGRAQCGDDRPENPLDALAWAISLAATLINPSIVVLSGGALRQSWFDREALEDRVADFTYQGVGRTPIVLSTVADPNLRGAALLAKGSS